MYQNAFGVEKNYLQSHHRLFYDIVPSSGSEALQFIESFECNDITTPIQQFKKFKYFSPQRYQLTPAQLKSFKTNSNLLKNINLIWKSNANFNSKMWAFDHIHNNNGLPLNRATCLVCSNKIEPYHFVVSCTAPSYAMFPPFFHNLDKSYSLYLLHLKLKYDDFHNFNNLLLDFKLI